MYLILCCSYLNHSLRFVGEKKEEKKKSHIKSQSQYFGKKSQLDYFPKSFSPNLMCSTFLMCSTYCVCMFLCLLYAPIHQKKFQEGVNLLGNESNSDSDSDSDSSN